MSFIRSLILAWWPHSAPLLAIMTLIMPHETEKLDEGD